MKTANILVCKRSLSKTRVIVFLFFLCALSLLSSTKMNAQVSDPLFIQGKDTLVVYKNVPGLAPSNKYAVRVRSAATNNEWVDCFTHYTYNKASDLPDDGVVMPTTNFHYQLYTDKWSQSYANFEMSKNSPVEVEISTVNGFKVQGKNFEKVAAHPAHRVSIQPQIIDGKIYFTIDNPGQIVIDINGQMDDFNKAIDDKSVGQTYVTHTIAIFANPTHKKPSLTASRVHAVRVGTMPSTDAASYDIMYFEPGVHDIGRNFKVHPGKQYYIPGDAIVYGSFNNYGVPTGTLRANGENIKIYGLGTVSGERITHPNYVPGDPDQTEFKTFSVENGLNVEINGITIIDPANHSVNFNAWSGRDRMKEVTFARWVKIISWRANGDGIGSAHLVEDCYLHTADDASYIKGNRRRIVFWKDANAAMFHMAAIPEVGTSFPLIIEDCDVIYNRTRGVSGGGVFVQRSEGTPGQRFVDVTVRNFRVTDPRSNMPTFFLTSKKVEAGVAIIGSSYSGLTFQNVTISKPIYGGRKNEITGGLEAPWYGGVCFDNVTINGELLTEPVFLRDFTKNEFVTGMCFKNSQNFYLTINNPLNGTIISNPSLEYYIDGTKVTVTATPKPGYEFSSWTGDVSGTTNPLTVVMNSNKTVSAIFQKQTTFIFETPGANSWIVPDGVTSITLKTWGGGGAGGSAYCGLATVNTQARGGGGAGGSFAGITLDVTPGQVVNYTIGAGGIGAASGFTDLSVGQSGSASIAIINTITVISAVGGTGGVNRSLTNQIASGNGGVAPTEGNIGTIAYYGGNGGTGGAGGPGGGGGSAGEQGNGGNGVGNVGGTAGSGGGIVGTSGSNTTNPGNNGLNPGGGGAGAAVRNNTPFTANNTHKTGGNGGNGKLIIIVNQSLSTNENTNTTKNKIIIYPNPATDKLFVNSNGLDVNKIQLIDSTGKIIYTVNKLEQNQSIDLSTFSRGLYLIKVHTSNGIYTEKIIKR